MNIFKNCIEGYLDSCQYTLETWAACTKTINLRCEKIITKPICDPQVVNEITRMNTEKLEAGLQVYQQLQSNMLKMDPTKHVTFKAYCELLEPVNKKAVENVERLSK